MNQIHFIDIAQNYNHMASVGSANVPVNIGLKTNDE